MNLTQHFTLEEMTASQTAARNGIDNTPADDIKANLLNLCTDVLEPLHNEVGAIKIDSGYRSPLVNRAVGGAASSQHCKGQAADTIAYQMTLKDYYAKVKELVKSGKLVVDQCIFEFNSWVHISYVKDGNNRKEFLIAENQSGRTVYIHDEA
ncbi:MAG: D-Ala-D-Ala carboxypeptidase family metallohydrolase [Ignavibacteriaceae bacterium]